MKATPNTARVQRLREITRTHPLWGHPFLLQCASGAVSLAEVRALAGQMYQFTRHFSRFLGKIVAACTDEAARVVLTENLFEELGEGDPTRTHPQLFRKFTRALMIDDGVLERMTPEPETQNLIRTYFDLPDRYGYVAATGAICFASEGIVSTLYANLQRGIEGAVPLPPDALEFFALHVTTDTEHAAKLLTVVEPHLVDQRVSEQVEAAVREAMNARIWFFDGVSRLALGLNSNGYSLAGATEVTL